jgi:hypothetical protein
MTLVSDVHTNSDESVNNNQLGSNYSYADLGGQCCSASLASTQKQCSIVRLAELGEMGFKALIAIHLGFSRSPCAEIMRAISTYRMVVKELTKPNTVFLTMHG